MRHVQRLFLVNLMLFIFACHNEPASRDNEAADRGSLCTTAGATLNSTTNECECSGGRLVDDALDIQTAVRLKLRPLLSHKRWS